MEEGKNNEPSTSGTQDIVNRLRTEQETVVKEEPNSDSDYYETDEEDSKTVSVIPDTIPEEYDMELERNLSKNDKHGEKDEDVGKPRKKRKYTTSKIPPHLKGLMGQANIEFAQGNIELAEKMCFEIIRQVPCAAEPYTTLSQIYENTHPEKCMQYLTIAALLERSSSNWIRLAEMHLEKNNLKQAVTCYTKAIAVEPTNVELQYKRLSLLVSLNDYRYIQRCKVRILNILRPEDHHLMIPLAKEVVEKFHSDKEYHKAVDAMYVPFNKCPDKITPEMVNIMLELLLLTNSYSNCIDIFVQFCNIEIEIFIDDDRKINIDSFSMPPDILIDLKIKFTICMIRLGAFHLLDSLLTPLLCEENVEVNGDLYLDVAEALMKVNKYFDALKLLVPLVKSNNFSLAAVWLKYADCLRYCNMTEQAIDSYYTVMKMAPQHTEVRHSLYELLVQENRTDEALSALAQEPGCEMDVSLLIKKINFLKELGRNQEYYEAIILMLSRHCIIIQHYEEIKPVLHVERVSRKTEVVNMQRAMRGASLHEKTLTTIRDPPIEEEQEIVRQALKHAYKQREYKYLKKMTVIATGSSRFKSDFLDDLLIATYYGCFLSGDHYHAYTVARQILLRYPYNKMSYNFMSFIQHSIYESRCSRFMIRVDKQLKCLAVKFLLANHCLAMMNSKCALMHFTTVLVKSPDPLIFLLMCMTYMQIVRKGKIQLDNKKFLPIIYGFMLSYVNSRGADASNEIYYNLGRFYHQYGKPHLAVKCYEKVLETNTEYSEAYPDICCLKSEAAFNLHLIYKESENYIGARNILQKYLTI